MPSPDTKLAVRKRTTIDIANDSPESLDLSALAQLAHDSQTRAIAAALKYLHKTFRAQGTSSLRELLRNLEEVVDQKGLDVLVPRDRIDGFLARPRLLEIGMAINRLVCIRDLDCMRGPARIDGTWPSELLTSVDF